MIGVFKPLVISRSYLWDKSSTGQIQRVFWEYAKDHGFEPTILCSQSYHNDVPVDNLKSNLIPTIDNQLIRYLIAFLKRTVAEELAYTPDYSLYSWGKISAIRHAKKEACSGKYDYIHSVCTPYSSHLIALEAKEVSGLPWIASFYDPWFNNPYRPIKSKNLIERDRRYEAKVAERADVILHTNQAIYNEWVERYGEEIKKKMTIQPLAFNTPPKKNKDLVFDRSKYVIAHIGSLFPRRDSVDFLKALRMMLDEHPDLENKILLDYVGTVTDDDKRMVHNYGFSSFTTFAGFLSEKECQTYFERADMFLAIDGKDSRNIFFPSKIMKYFYYGKPILGLTPKGSALQYELERSQNFCFENEDYKGVSDFLYKSIKHSKAIKEIDKDYWKNFTMEMIFPKYIEIVSSLLQKS